MSARFVQLRIAGFKSFADPVSVDILPGLTGIVGPNGCGKSNVVEALRWAMGESSARSLRGGEMDDLIFAGTTSRPARNLAEVTLVLENAKGLGPGPFAEQDDLEVSRRAERGSGSDYRLNSKAIRARDVQTLFADLASGARSSAMVSQGRVAMLVGARPEERRTILEEAAGITGLHARRHEAELKLRATESNLTRAEDLRTQLENRLEGLTGQSEQASRYRELSSSLRDAEISLLALLHARARQQVERARLAAVQARNALIAAEEASETAVLADYEADKALPAIREAAELARTALERQKVAAEGVALEEQRAAQAAEAATERLRQSEADRDAARSRLEDASATLTRLQDEMATVQAAQTSLPDRQADAEAGLTRIQAALQEASETLERLMAEATAARTRSEQAQAALESATLRHTRLAEDHDALKRQIEALQAELPAQDVLAEAEASVQQAATTLARSREEADAASQKRSEAQVALSIARNAAETTRTRHIECEKAFATATATLNGLRKDRDALAQRKEQTERELIPDTQRSALAQAVTDAEVARTQAVTALEAAETERAAASAALVEARGRMQEDNTTRASVAAAVQSAEAALRRAEQEAATFARELATAEQNAVPDAVLEQAQNARAAEEKRLNDAELGLANAEEAATQAETDAQQAETALGTLKAELTRLKAQIEGLSQALGADEEDSAAPISGQLDIPDGMEIAIATVLAEGLDAPDSTVAPDASRSWSALGPLTSAPALPPEATPLASLLASVPPTLTRALGQAGLVASVADGDSLVPSLQAGQSLVTRDGAFWRWDGYRIAAGQPSAAAQRLAQRRILKETQFRFDEKSADLPATEQRASETAQARTRTNEAVRTARMTRAAIEGALGKVRTAEAETSRRHAAARARLDAVRPQCERATQALAAAKQAVTDAQATQTALPAPEVLRAAHEEARTRDQKAIQTEAAARESRRKTEAAFEQARRAQQETETRHGNAESRLGTMLPELVRLDSERSKAEETVEAARLALEASSDPASAATALKNAETTAQEAEQAAIATRAGLEAASQEMTRLEAVHRTMQEKALEARSRLSATEPRLAALGVELLEAAATLESAEAACAATVLDAQDSDPIETLREKISELRREEQTGREARAALVAEIGSLTSRDAALRDSLSEWTVRAATAEEQLTEAQLRFDAVTVDHQTLTALPDEARQLRERTAAALSGAEESFSAANAAREAAESRLKDAQESRRQTEGGLATARENLLRSEGKSEQAQAILDQLLAETPDPPTAPVGDLTESAETGLRRKISRLTREREELGPVNLRADIEAQEAEQQIEVIRREHGEIEAAIARLRGSIGSLNKEGRERLMAVFTQVDHHFQSLFSRMFGGGRAHLGLVGSDDPLQAGLEIYAQPPGKKLATLSLLSGGEQALTALSLIFAVFRCNPAPICVLDEVDAPLDDANVGRFCALLGDMVNEAGTRFLVVTHHQLTMAHMDRLYGVTMQERGVSRVLSVDLDRAAAMAGERKKEEAHA
ncbi:AAA family ATPase [Acetobacter sp.]|jgi:chromosome segregation protein|uniref:AAA family ATPase n=1 Tax=Acetobacter sp. TaxID=440 RepID=UPI0025BB9867|nr:AAA family ATPase [Acetobacter sp.]MCH4090275.1 AAA family ATPase [Acetobacter sp.]MCI1298969.1 AAA family ATPase [Acetobacter sp.]MCI1314989.1 AAA family ATPase [Acetobacter sp.]